MVAKSKKKADLGRTLIKNRFKSAASSGHRLKENPDGSIVKHTTDINDNALNSKMQSITQENDLEAFLAHATLAGTEFTAERLQIQVVSKGYKNPFLLSETEEQETLAKHKQFQNELTVPRRPVWDGIASPEIQQGRERNAFLDWRRSLVSLEEEKGLLMTPYERNIEVWRQLWRVIERSDLVVQIVDARNPLLFRSVDLETYVHQVDQRKKNLLLINKADMLTRNQRIAWANYFDSQGIRYTFFSAALERQRLAEEEQAEKAAKEREAEEEDRVKVLEAMKELGLSEPTGVEYENDGVATDEEGDRSETGSASKREEQDDDDEQENETDSEYYQDEEDFFTEEVRFGVPVSTSWRKGAPAKDEGTASKSTDRRIHISSSLELLDLFAQVCPSALRVGEKKRTIGFVGYPNVGKSSTLNALVGTKKVTVSATPGKTKHFQTIHLDDATVLCDCPGLVFPSFATTKAEMVINGVLPIDQLREHTAPSTLVAQRIPRHALETIYGIRIRTLDEEGNLDMNGAVTGEDLCQAYAIARGFKKSGQGNPDESRAARIVLKDYVQGKLLYCHPPPDLKVTPAVFNAEVYAGDEYRRKGKKRTTNVNELLSDWSPFGQAGSNPADEALMNRSLDANFFKPARSGAAAGGEVGVKTKGKFASQSFTRSMLYPHQVGAVASAGQNLLTPSVKGKGKAAVALATTLPTAPPGMGFGLENPGSKKHKKVRRGKIRDRWTADDRAD
ncbi:P-loop containing nucleoside triphosphate hydrolase protein [Zopfochytrium polystomum]|nr:P-loop containing nucleoside triphosphate hydrolase protein [Zopfochytrium polystomum]